MSASLAEQIMKGMQGAFIADKAAGVDAVVQFNLTGDGGGQYTMTFKDGKLGVEPGTAPNAKMTITATAQDYADIATGKLNPMAAFSSGKIKIGGDMMFGMKFMSFFGKSM